MTRGQWMLRHGLALTVCALIGCADVPALGKAEQGTGGNAADSGVGGHAASAVRNDVAGESGSAGQSRGGSGGVDGHAGSAAGSGGSKPSCGVGGSVKCAADEYCMSEPDKNCGPVAIGGVCQQKSHGCADIYHAVCGCDNVTYGNDCEAHARGVAVRWVGVCGAAECTAAGGRILNSDGRSTMKCDPAEESWSIGARDATTLCCRATKLAQSIKCGRTGDPKCDDGQFCKLDLCDNSANPAGACEPNHPDWCTRDYWPVCGCDNHTYNNTCEAHLKGASVMRDGPCTD